MLSVSAAIPTTTEPTAGSWRIDEIHAEHERNSFRIVLLSIAKKKVDNFEKNVLRFFLFEWNITRAYFGSFDVYFAAKLRIGL